MRQAGPSKPPPGWPPEIRYITRYVYHSSVTQEAQDIINRADGKATAKDDRPLKGKTNIVIREISDATIQHPLAGQRGLFAAQKIPPKTWIVDYLGEVHCEERPESNYDLSLHRTQEGLSIGIDASQMGNEARFVNDFRGIRCRPNCVFVERRTCAGQMRVSIYSSSEMIRKGEELVVSYGKKILVDGAGGEALTANDFVLWDIGFLNR